LRLFDKLNLPNTQAFAALSLPKIHQKYKPFKNQALYGQTLADCCGKETGRPKLVNFGLPVCLFWHQESILG